MTGITGVVVIGRNEGVRLLQCLKSIDKNNACVYVDSGSIDGSAELAKEMGFDVVELASPPSFSAARARNAGLDYLAAKWPQLELIQMIDGDCELQANWLRTATDVLQNDPELGLVFGRRRERYPNRSIYNALCDDEWNVPVGEALVAGGDVLCRTAALREIGGYREDMVAGEDPDLAIRLRTAGWRLRRIDAEMTLHDAAILQFDQWWKRSERAGHAFAELLELHPNIKDPNWQRKCSSIIGWGFVMPVLTVTTFFLESLINSWSYLITTGLLLTWPLKMLQIAARKRKSGICIRNSYIFGFLLMLSKFPELVGLSKYRLNHLFGKKSVLIEYKTVL